MTRERTPARSGTAYTRSRTSPAMDRRRLIGRLGLAGLGAALATTVRLVPAAADDRAEHPMVGHWLAATPLGPAHVVFEPDGTVLIAWPRSAPSERETFPPSTSAVGFWQAVSARGIHFTVVRLDSEAGGPVIGTTSLEAIVEANEDGKGFRTVGATKPVTSWASVGMTRLVVHQAAGMEMAAIRMWPEAA